MTSQFSGMALRAKCPIPYTRSHRACGLKGLGAGIESDVSEIDIIKAKPAGLIAMNAPGKALVLSALTLLVAVFLPAPASAGIKCWTNDEGVRECGDAVPPEYAQKAHRELSDTGLTVSTTERAKTKEELREQREEAARQAAIRADEERRIREQKMKDRVLLSTFTSEDDLKLSHEGQVSAIDLRIEHTEKIVLQLESSLEELHRQAAKLERSGKPMTPELESKMTRVENQLEESKNFIEKRQLQKAELAAQFEQDLERYRELKGTARND